MIDESPELKGADNLPVKRAVENKHALALPVEPNSQSYGGFRGGTGTDDNINRLRNYWRSVRKHLLMIVCLTIIVTGLVAVYASRLPNIYEATARVQVDLENGNPVLGGMNKNNSIIVNTADPAYFNTQLEILSSDGLMRRVVKLLDLEHNQAFVHPQPNKNLSTWRSVLRMVGIGKEVKEDEKPQTPNVLQRSASLNSPGSREDLDEINNMAPLVSFLQGRLSVTQVKGTRLIEIRFTHPDSRLTAKVANTIADAFVLANLEKKTETNASTGDFLQKRIAELQSRIRTGEEQLINYAKNNEILSLDASQNTVVDRLTGLNRQLLEAENERKLAEATYRAGLDNGAAEALAQAGDTKQLSSIEGRLTELRQKRAQLLVDNTEDWPEVKEVNQQIASLEKQREESQSQATSVIKKNLETRYRQARAREESLRDAFNKQRGQTLTQNEAAINYRIIQQEIETNKTLLDGLLQRSKENEVIMAGTPNNIHVSDYAPVPRGPIGPERFRMLAVGLLLSLVAGVGLALFLEFLDDTIRSTDDVETMLQLPALAVIPLMGKPDKRFFPNRKALQLRNGNDSREQTLLLEADQRTPLAEAYRQLRTSVLLSTPGRAPKTFLVTSSLPSEGKTTTVVNTARTLAQTGVNVLIIDADMRRPRIHSIFGLENKSGLSTLLSSDMSEVEMLLEVEQYEGSRLHLLTSGPIPPNPAELLGSVQMQKLITTLERTFTHIVIDSPPVVSFTDGVIISSMVDGVLLVVHGGKSSRQIVRRSRKMLQEIGAKIFGVVLNKIEANHDDYYYKHYYQKYYSEKYEAAPESH